VIAACAAIVIASCSVERPTVQTTTPTEPPLPTTTGDPAIDAIIDDLRSPGTFDASYTLTRKLGNVTNTGRVVSQAPQVVVTIADTQFFIADQVTCRASLCEAGILDQYAADVGIFSPFYGPSPAAQIVASVARRNGEPKLFTRTVAGADASCVSIEIGPGVETYCVIPDGPLAFVDRADVRIELTASTTTVDAATLVPSSPVEPATDAPGA
jgi:hypothetical protein